MVGPVCLTLIQIMHGPHLSSPKDFATRSWRRPFSDDKSLQRLSARTRTFKRPLKVLSNSIKCCSEIICQITIGLSIGLKQTHPDPIPTHPETDKLENPNQIPAESSSVIPNPDPSPETKPVCMVFFVFSSSGNPNSQLPKSWKTQTESQSEYRSVCVGRCRSESVGIA